MTWKQLIFQSDGKPYLCLTLNAKTEQEAYTFHASKVNSRKHLTLDKPVFVEGLSLISGLYSQVAYFHMAFPQSTYAHVGSLHLLSTAN